MRYRGYKELPANNRPDSVSAAIKDCDPDYYSNIHVLLQLAGMLPVSSCECERSVSALQHLNNCMIASMGKQQLACTLPVSSCKCERSVSALQRLNNSINGQAAAGKPGTHSYRLWQTNQFREVVDIYAQLHPRWIELDFLNYKCCKIHSVSFSSSTIYNFTWCVLFIMYIVTVIQYQTVAILYLSQKVYFLSLQNPSPHFSTSLRAWIWW